MISRIEGKLVRLTEDTAEIEVASVTYEVMLPAYCVAAMGEKIGSEVSLCTMQYLEGTPAGSNFIPRVIGFLTRADREFFKKFTSVKGIGMKKALKCLAIPIGRIAAAIEAGDEKILATLPSVGKRMSQQIIAELKGKLGAFAVGEETSKAEPVFKPFQSEALEILIAWGEKRAESMELLQLACERHPEITTAEEIVPLVYRLKQGIEV